MASRAILRRIKCLPSFTRPPRMLPAHGREYPKCLPDMAKEAGKTSGNLEKFMNKVRTGGTVSTDDIFGFAKLFSDQVTLDNISRPRLVNMCKYMDINPDVTDAYLRYMLRKRLQQIKSDDKMIEAEGVESLSEAELRQACRFRGLLELLPVQEMRQQLLDWLDLSLKHCLPSSLLILSRAFRVPGKVRPEEVVQATLSSLPDEVVDAVQVTSFSSLPDEVDIMLMLTKLDAEMGDIQSLLDRMCKENWKSRLKRNFIELLCIVSFIISFHLYAVYMVSDPYEVIKEINKGMPIGKKIAEEVNSIYSTYLSWHLKRSAETSSVNEFVKKMMDEKK